MRDRRGAALAQFVPWVAAHGVDLPLFFAELFANRISGFFAWDVIVSAVVVLAFAFLDETLGPRQRACVAAATLLVGVSCGLPLALFFRGGSQAAPGDGGPPRPGG